MAEPDFEELDGAVREDDDEEDEPLEPEDVELPLELPELDEPELDEPLELDPELGRETACWRCSASRGIEAVGASRQPISALPPDPPLSADEVRGAAGGLACRDC